jgi:hypothetical protein
VQLFGQLLFIHGRTASGAGYGGQQDKGNPSEKILVDKRFRHSHI